MIVYYFADEDIVTFSNGKDNDIKDDDELRRETIDIPKNREVAILQKKLDEEVKNHRNFEPVIAITVLSLVSVLYLTFSLIQIVYLFLGGGSLPEGYSADANGRETTSSMSPMPLSAPWPPLTSEMN